MTGGGNLEATSAPKGSFQVQLEVGGRRSALRLSAITETPSEYCKPNRKDVSGGRTRCKLIDQTGNEVLVQTRRNGIVSRDVQGIRESVREGR